MQSFIYTYKQKNELIFFKKQKYYLIKNQKQLDKLIDELMKIDAVSYPVIKKFPCVLKLLDGFAPNLVRSSKKEFKKECKESLKDLITQHKKIVDD